MSKGANVQIVQRIDISGGLVTVIVSGDMASVCAAVKAGAKVAGEVGERVCSHVIPNPAEGLTDVFLRAITHAKGEQK